jgi:EAL domain-containing protein (putative c-di-GMP-specific phosphodiesterase class I)
VSARQLQGGGLAERVASLIEKYAISPTDLEIELTESMIMANPEEVSAVLARLRATGITIAIDDFGTGYSSLAYLRRLPIDVLKIDRSFVTNADHDEDDAQIVRIIVALGDVFHLEVVAEGVETSSQAEFLKSCGCSITQGFLHSPPLPAAVFRAWLRIRSRLVVAQYSN